MTQIHLPPIFPVRFTSQLFGMLFIAAAVFDDYLDEHTYRVEIAGEDGDDVNWVEVVDGREIRYTEDPETSGWRRFNEDIYSILPIESQL